MSGRVTSLPACKAALKLCAPRVSMAMMGTCCQPTSNRPAVTPAKSPPPPTASTTAPGGVPSDSFSSRTRLAWPSLWGLRGIHDGTSRTGDSSLVTQRQDDAGGVPALHPCSPSTHFFTRQGVSPSSFQPLSCLFPHQLIGTSWGSGSRTLSLLPDQLCALGLVS